jgi:hypothetical protein
MADLLGSASAGDPLWRAKHKTGCFRDVFTPLPKQIALLSETPRSIGSLDIQGNFVSCGFVSAYDQSSDMV